MKANLYPLIQKSRTMLSALVLLPFVVGFAACSSDPVTDSYANLKEFPAGTEAKITVPAEGWEDEKQKRWFNFYSDYTFWEIEVEYLFDEESDWLTVWPLRGAGDGRFSILVKQNADTPYLREANINIKSGGNTIQSFTVSQDAAAPRLELDMEGMTRLMFSSKASEKTAKLSTNVVWKAEVIADSNPDEKWLSFGDFTQLTQAIAVTENSGDAYRTAVVRFTMLGGPGEKFVDLDIIQRDKSSSPENATLKTIAEILAQVGPGGGEISGNVYVEGYVTSDLSTRNFDVKRQWPVTDPTSTFDQTKDYEKRFMWVQDASERGMMFEWPLEGLNTYALNTKVKIHLIGCTVVKDTFTGSLKISNFEPDIVFESEQSDGIAPVELSSLDNIDDYENTLVKLNPVQFALPYGTYVNIDEKFFNAIFTTVNTMHSVPYCETSRQYGHLIMDGKGNTIRLVTECTFTERYIRTMPEGSGPLTAIVTKNYLANENHYVLRIRRDSDNEVSSDVSTRFTNIVTRFGPRIQDPAGSTTITADQGNGSLKTSVYTSLGSNSSTGVYWSYTYARFVTSGITIDADGVQSTDVPQPESVTESVYACFNANNVWNPTLASSILDSKVGGWIITLSTVGVTGDLVLSFDTNSSRTGPGWMRLQWREIVVPEDEFALKDQWNMIVPRYEIGSWDVNYHLQQYSFKLPDELKGKNKIMIRHITDFEDGGGDALRAQRNPTGANTVSNGGTNRMGVWTLEEIK